MDFNCFIISICYFMVIFISRVYSARISNPVREYTILIAANFQKEFNCNSSVDKDALTQVKRIISESNGCKIYVGNILNARYGNRNITEGLSKANRILQYLELDFIMFGVNELAYGESIVIKLMETFRNKIPFNNVKYSASSEISPPHVCPAIIGYATDSMGDVAALVNTLARYKQKQHAVIAIGCQNVVPMESIVKQTSSIIMIINGCDSSQLEAMTLANSHGQSVVYISPQSSIHSLTKIFIRIKHDGNNYVLDHYNASQVAVRQTRTAVEHASNATESITGKKPIPLGKTMVFLNGQCYRSECNFGSLIADAFIQYTYNNYRGNDWTDTAIALVAAGAIFTSINATDKNNTIYREDIEYTIYDDQLVTVEISGMDIRRSLNHGFDLAYKQGDAKFLQVSGLRIIYDPLKQSMQKLISVKVRTKVGVPMYTLLTRSDKYYVIMTKSLANGDFGHTYFRQNGKIIREENMTAVEAVCQYISEINNVYHFNTDRILVQASLTSSAVKLWALQTSLKSIFVIITFATIY